ncbi:MAG: sugar phosphate isomerase/epimerase [Bryobacterales bacterium]|nr:sugar phosphate isomerase/epimerase [Bryobacterales bacterium]
MKITRRESLSALVGAASIPALPALAQDNKAGGHTPQRYSLAVSTYSYWHFEPVKFPIEKVIENAARIGFEGVEILHRQMADETPSYCMRLKQMAFDYGLSLPMLSIHQDFVEPEADERTRNVEHTIKCIELAARMGIPAVRLNSGRWGTTSSFDELMTKAGIEPPLPGYTDEDAFKWVGDCIQRCIPTAQREGVAMCIENHWGLTTSVDNLIRIYKESSSPWLKMNVDTGNYPGDPYEGLQKLAPYAHIIQAKTYEGGGVWYTLNLDYKRIARILREAGFKGWISLEMEGKEPAETAVPKAYKTLRDAFTA